MIPLTAAIPFITKTCGYRYALTVVNHGHVNRPALRP